MYRYFTYLPKSMKKWENMTCSAARPRRPCRGSGPRGLSRGWSHGGSDDFTVGEPISVALEQKSYKIKGHCHKIVDPITAPRHGIQ